MIQIQDYKGRHRPATEFVQRRGPGTGWFRVNDSTYPSYGYRYQWAGIDPHVLLANPRRSGDDQEQEDTAHVR